MKTKKLFVLCFGFLTMTMMIQGCSSYEPVPVAKCKTVVKHAQKVLGSMSPSYKELMTSCKKASDSERGCIMAATKKGHIAQCY